MRITVRHSWGNKVYTDKDLDYLYEDFLKAWNNYQRCPSLSSYATEVIASFNEYYYEQNRLREEVRRHMNPKWYERMIDQASFSQDSVNYSCRFSRELPYRSEVMSLVARYGRFTYGDHKWSV